MKHKSSNYAVVMKDTTCGYGVISQRDFEIGEKIGDIHGTIQSEIVQHSLQVSPTQHIVDLNFAGYLLHSCDPNVSVNMPELTVTALKPIRRGEHLYMDYAQTEDQLFKQFHCQCGSEHCRGWIVGRREVSEKKRTTDIVAEEQVA